MEGNLFDFDSHIRDCEKQQNSQESFCGDFGPDGTPPVIQDGNGAIYWDMGDYLLKIDPYVRKPEENDVPQTKIKSMKKELSEENYNKKLVSAGTEKGQKQSKIRSCPYCEKMLKKSRINLHINIVHDTVCPKCPTVQRLHAKAFVKHCKSSEHEAAINYKCSACPFSTGDLKKFRYHRLKFHGNLLQNCGISANAPKLKRQNMGTDEQQIFHCPFGPCSYSQGDVWNLKIHVHTVHDPRCPHCDYVSGTEMQKHLTLDHTALDDIYVCGKCKCATHDPMKFWKHRKENHGKCIIPTPHVTKEEKADEHKCVYCEHKTKDLKKMFIHVHEHHDPCCTQCHWVSREDNEGMAQHMASFGHTWYEISKVKCSAFDCVKRFPTFYDYWQHRFTEHGRILYNINRRPSKNPSGKTNYMTMKRTTDW